MIDFELKKQIAGELLDFLVIYYNDLLENNLLNKKIEEWAETENKEDFIKKEIIKAYLFSNPQYDEISEEIINDKAIVEILKNCFKYNLYKNFEWVKDYDLEKVITSLNDEKLTIIRQEIYQTGGVETDTLIQCGVNKDYIYFREKIKENWNKFLNEIKEIVDKEYNKRLK